MFFLFFFFIFQLFWEDAPQRPEVKDRNATNRQSKWRCWWQEATMVIRRNNCDGGNNPEGVIRANVAMATMKMGGGGRKPFRMEFCVPATSGSKPIHCNQKKILINSNLLWLCYSKVKDKMACQIRKDVWGDGLILALRFCLRETAAQHIFRENSDQLHNKQYHNKMKTFQAWYFFSILTAVQTVQV